MINKITIKKTKDNRWIDKVNEFIKAVETGCFNSSINLFERLVIMVDTYIIGEFHRDDKDPNKIEFYFVKGCEWVSNNNKINKYKTKDLEKKLALSSKYESFVPDAVEELNIGDWVETCHMLPGIITEIEYDENGYPEDICAWIPGYHKAGEYGGSHSVHHCGVHRISGEYARILLSIGETKLKELYHEWSDNYIDNEIDWSDYITNYYNKNFKN